MIIYKTTNLLNYKFYIGQDFYNDKNYYGSGKKFKSALKKYGKENFRKDILEFCSSQKELDKREKFWIKLTRTKEFGYNLCDGGGGTSGYKHSEKSKRKIGLSSIGNKNTLGIKFSEEINKKKGKYGILHHLYGKHHSEETKLKMSQSHLGKKQSEKTKEKRRQSMIGKNKGKIFTEEHKRKIGLAGLGRKHSEETKLKMSQSHTGIKRNKHSDKTKEKMKQSHLGQIPWNKNLSKGN